MLYIFVAQDALQVVALKYCINDKHALQENCFITFIKQRGSYEKRINSKNYFCKKDNWQ